MNQCYVPNHGFGPLTFGMSSLDVEGVLGAPTSFRSPFEGIPLDRETKPFEGEL